MTRFHYTPDNEWPVPVAEPAMQGKTDSILDTLRAYADAATLMRLAGALTVIAAMSAFLMQDWSDGSDMQRFYMLLAQTVLLAGGGFGLSFLMKENKGARVFFGLGLLSVTANMATLGALVFSVTQWGSELAIYPGFAKWQADPASLGLAMAAGLAVSAPIAWFGYMVMARRSAAILSALFLFTNLLLLLPVRESLLAGLVALIGMAAPLWFLRNRMAEDVSLRTPEGYFAIATLFAPVLIVTTRSLWLYQADALLQAMLGVMALLLLRTASPLAAEDSRTRGLMDYASLATALFIAYPLADMAATLAGASAFHTVFSATFAGLGLELALRGGARKGAFIAISAWVLAIAHLLALADIGHPLNAVLCIAAGGAILMTGKWSSQRPLLVLGAATAFAGLAQQAYDIVVLVNFSSWITLAVLGVSTIIAASVLERYGAVIKARWAAMASPDASDDA